MQGSKRKGLIVLLRQYIPRPSELFSLCKLKLKFTNYGFLNTAIVAFMAILFKKCKISILTNMFVLPFILHKTSCSHVEPCHLLLFSM